MLQVFRSLYIKPRTFIALGLLIFLFILSFVYTGLFRLSQLLLLVLVLSVLLDGILLFRSNKIKASRILPEKLSNGDDNPIEIKIQNQYNFNLDISLIDELPIQYQERNFEIITKIPKNGKRKLNYRIRPKERGEYHFGKLNIYVSSPLGLLSKRYVFGQNEMVPNYPSFLQLKKYMLIAFSNRISEFGLKKIRKIGHTMEFEQIKDYVKGDDIRTINWKATAKSNKLMVNQYQDERSQPIYSVIDKGRVMKMPFAGLSLLDYAINATLVISNVALKKQDKAGLFSFSRKVENAVIAQKRPSQMNLIMETLYNLKTDFAESDFSRLYIDLKRRLTQRSLVLLYTNFETLDALHRQLPYLQGIAKNHVLVVIFFENTELDQLIHSKAKTTQQIFDKIIAQKFAYEKKLIVNELQKYGIQTILTAPQDLTINTINKYLEIKARGLI